MISTNGSLVLKKNFNSKVFKDGQTSKSFNVKKANKLYGIRIYTPSLQDKWAFFDVKVVDKAEKVKYFDMPTSLSFYDGYEGGEYWSEGSTEVTSYFKIPEKGEFKLTMAGEGGSGSTAAKSFSLPNTIVEIREGVRQGHYTLIWFFLCLFASVPFFAVKFGFEASRWSDGDDDEDDD